MENPPSAWRALRKDVHTLTDLGYCYVDDGEASLRIPQARFQALRDACIAGPLPEESLGTLAVVMTAVDDSIAAANSFRRAEGWR